MARKRAPGGGRKKKAQRKSSWLQVRVTPELRDTIEREAKKGGRKLSAEIAKRIERRGVDGPPEVRAICFLIEKTVTAVLSFSVGLDPEGDHRKKQIAAWRSNPFLFEAFRLAVVQLLDALKPKGEIKPPIANLDEWAASENPWSRIIARTNSSPQALADHVFEYVLQRFKTDQPLTGGALYGAHLHGLFDDIEAHYGFANARRDLINNEEKP